MWCSFRVRRAGGGVGAICVVVIVAVEDIVDGAIKLISRPKNDMLEFGFVSVNVDNFCMF